MPDTASDPTRSFVIHWQRHPDGYGNSLNFGGSVADGGTL
jgi:hypothetical protein